MCKGGAKTIRKHNYNERKICNMAKKKYQQKVCEQKAQKQ